MQNYKGYRINTYPSKDGKCWEGNALLYQGYHVILEDGDSEENVLFKLKHTIDYFTKDE